MNLTATTTLEELRTRAGLKMTDLATTLGLTYNEVYSAEKNEGKDVRRNADKIRRNQQLLREYLEQQLAAQQRESDARRLKTKDAEGLDDQQLRVKAQAHAEKVAGTCPPGWVKLTEWNGLRTGDLLHVHAVDGTFSFIAHVTTPSGKESVSCYGGHSGSYMLRSFRPDQVI